MKKIFKKEVKMGWYKDRSKSSFGHHCLLEDEQVFKLMASHAKWKVNLGSWILLDKWRGIEVILCRVSYQQGSVLDTVQAGMFGCWFIEPFSESRPKLINYFKNYPLDLQVKWRQDKWVPKIQKGLRKRVFTKYILSKINFTYST